MAFNTEWSIVKMIAVYRNRKVLNHPSNVDQSFKFLFNQFR